MRPRTHSIGAIVCAGFLIALGGGNPSAAATSDDGVYTGNQLLDDCEAVNADLSFCLGFIRGASDLNDLMDVIENRHTFCLPDHVTLGQAKDVVLRYLREHPADRHLPGAALVIGAMRSAFPCGSTS